MLLQIPICKPKRVHEPIIFILKVLVRTYTEKVLVYVIKENLIMFPFICCMSKIEIPFQIIKENTNKIKLSYKFLSIE